MKYRTCSDYCAGFERQYTPCGCKTEPIYVKKVDADGEPHLEQVGEKNIYDIIQAHLDDTRIESLVARYEAGDNTVLGRLQGFYADLTQSATSLAEAENSLIKVENYYNSLPPEIRAKFDTLKKFVGAIGTDALKNTFDEYLAKFSTGEQPEKGSVTTDGNAE